MSGKDTGPAEDWYCGCREPAPDRIGMVAILRPARVRHCFNCGHYAPWTWEAAGWRAFVGRGGDTG